MAWWWWVVLGVIAYAAFAAAVAPWLGHYLSTRSDGKDGED